MKPSTIWYCIKQGIKNMCRNIRFTLASIATVSACIFLFCMFFAVISNAAYIVKNAEAAIGITVFFDESMSEEEIKLIGEDIAKRPEISSMSFVSAKEAWESFKAEYFAGKEHLAEGFADDNPLAGSASYTIYIKDISMQKSLVEYLEAREGIRSVNYSETAAAALNNFNMAAALLAALITGVLLLVSMFLISNTIVIAAEFRRAENKIMRLIGATNMMIRAPFIIEGSLIGITGALIPLAGIYFLYNHVINYAGARFPIFSGTFRFLPVMEIFPLMAAASFALGGGIGLIVSFFTIRKHLKV